MGPWMSFGDVIGGQIRPVSGALGPLSGLVGSQANATARLARKYGGFAHALPRPPAYAGPRRRAAPLVRPGRPRLVGRRPAAEDRRTWGT